jgi:hypothetical protein
MPAHLQACRIPGFNPAHLFFGFAWAKLLDYFFTPKTPSFAALATEI